jgi:rubrerythrin
MIGLLKPCLEQAIAGKRYSYGELATVMAEAAQVVNSRPIARGSEDTQAGGPITPLHLQLGRATVEVPRVRFEEAPSLTRRLQHAGEGVKQFWKKWMHLVFQEKLLSRTWRKVKRNVAVGDVVYMMEKDDDDEFCRMGVVEEVKAGPDGCIRTATIRYTNPGGDPHHRSAPKLAVRPIHKLAVIVPVDYRFEEDLAMGKADSRENAKRGAANERHGIREYNPDLEKNSQESRPKREAAQKAMDALKKGADATRGRGRRRGRVYQRAGVRN